MMTKRCDICSNEFTPTHREPNYCSPLCLEKALYLGALLSDDHRDAVLDDVLSIALLRVEASQDDDSEVWPFQADGEMVSFGCAVQFEAFDVEAALEAEYTDPWDEYGPYDGDACGPGPGN